MRRIRGARLVLALVVLGPVIAWGLARASAPERDRDAAYAAALGFAAEQLAEEGGTLCVSVDRGGTPQDPTPALLKRIEFAGPVLPGSRCHIDRETVVAPGPGDRALALTALSTERVGPAELWVTLRHFRTARYSGVRTYRVVQQGGAWVTLGQILRDSPF